MRVCWCLRSLLTRNPCHAVMCVRMQKHVIHNIACMIRATHGVSALFGAE